MEKLNYMHHAISIILQFVISNIHEHSSKLVLYKKIVLCTICPYIVTEITKNIIKKSIWNIFPI